MSLSVGATLSPSAYWYLARGTGAVALVLLTASVVIGIVGSVRVVTARWPRFAIDAVHRDVSLLVIVVLVIHIVTSVLDGFAPITLLDGVIPFVSPYRPLWLGLGTLAFDLLVAIAVTSLVRRRLGYRAWRTVHWLAYASWPVAVLHGLGTGSDVKQWWMLALTVICIVAVLRRGVDTDRPRLLRPRRPASAGDGARGDHPHRVDDLHGRGAARAGWARRAGTPSSLLGKPSAPAAARRRRLRRRAGVAQARCAQRTVRLDGCRQRPRAAGGWRGGGRPRAERPGSGWGVLRVRIAGTPITAAGCR